MRSPLLIPAALALLAIGTAAAPVAVHSGALSYTQDFDSLGAVTTAWTNDLTLPGWYAQINNGNTALTSARDSDGSSSAHTGLLNLGTAAAADRALGSKATGTGAVANIAYAVSLQNSGTTALALSTLTYTGELWRTNTGTGTPLVAVSEAFTLFYQVSNAPVTNIRSGTDYPTAVAGTGFTALGPGADWISPVNTPMSVNNTANGVLDGNAPANRTTVTYAPTSPIPLLPGQFLMIKWTDTNKGGTDGHQGIDDVTVTFTELNGVLTPDVTALTRHSNATPGDPLDDTFGLTVNVAGTGTGVSAGWRTTDVTAPNATAAAYGTPVTWSGFPVTEPKAVIFTDALSPLYTSAILVAPPKVIGLQNVPPGADNVFAETHPAWTVNETLRTLTMNNGSGAPAPLISSLPVNLSAASGVVRFDAILVATDTSSGFETTDTFLAELILHDGISETTVNLITHFDTNANGIMDGAEIAPGGGTTAAPTVRTYTLAANIPDNIVTARLVISGVNNSSNETFEIKDIQFSPAPTTLNATAPVNITRHENGPGLADDTVTFDTIITGINGGPSWTATGATPDNGAFGPVTFTVPASASPAVVIITDVSHPSATHTLSVTIPARYTIGFLYDGTRLSDLFSDPASPPAPAWINDPLLYTLDMTAGGSSDKLVASDILDLTATGEIHFSCVFRARETSTGTNFESSDRFKAELVIDGGTPGEQTINLVAAQDTGDGSSSTVAPGTNGPANGYLNGYQGIAGFDLLGNIDYSVPPLVAEDEYNANLVRDEFNRRGEIADAQCDNNFSLSATIPAAANTVQLRLLGAGISGSEFFTVSRIMFSTIPPTTDSDNDGVPDLTELTDGTDPHDPSSLFTVTTITAGPGGELIASFPTVAGRSYRGYFSTDLTAWTRDDSAPAVTGDGNAQTWTLLNTGARSYLRVLSGFTPADFPPALP